MTGLVVAITGPTGEIGRSLIRALEDDARVARVRGMSRSGRSGRDSAPAKTRYLRGDVTDPDDVAQLVDGADVVIHLAYAKFGPPTQTRAVNLAGSRTVFAAAVAAGTKRIVYTSSVAAYGFDHDQRTPLDEAYPARGSKRMHYSADKAELEEALAEAVAGTAVDAYTLRPCIVAGPDSLELVTRLPYVAASRALPSPIRGLARALPASPVLVDFGVPMQLVHGDDLAAALRAATIGDVPAGTYNVAGDGVVTISDLADELGWHCVGAPVSLLDAVAEAATRVPFAGARLDWIHALRSPVLMDTSKARAELGWRPRHDARETLRQTVAEARLRGVITNGTAPSRLKEEAPCGS
jgi:nucleoside-diphosphate-sugar epimerase